VITSNLKKAEALIEEGGDWDRRNRLKVYNGLHLLSIRQFKRGGELFSDALSTFTASELLSYNDFVALTVISNTLTLNRVDLKKKIINAPEVIQVLPELPVLGDLVKNLYECHYDKFFIALGKFNLLYSMDSFYSSTFRSVSGANLPPSFTNTKSSYTILCPGNAYSSV